ncbi:hypothetical protein D3C85_1795320 [compost metagenome]
MALSGVVAELQDLVVLAHVDHPGLVCPGLFRGHFCVGNEDDRVIHMYQMGGRAVDPDHA